MKIILVAAMTAFLHIEVTVVPVATTPAQPTVQSGALTLQQPAQTTEQITRTPTNGAVLETKTITIQ